MNRIHFLAAMLALSLSSVRAESQPYDFDAPTWNREVLRDSKTVSNLLKQAFKERKLKQFYLSVDTGAPVRLDKTMPQPWDKTIPKDPSTISFRLRQLLEEGRLAEFYLLAREKLHTTLRELEETNHFSERHYQDRLWMLYYIAAAPLVTIDENPNVPPPPLVTDDYDLKRSALFQTGFQTISDEEYLRYEREHRKELLHLFASYSAGVLKAVRDSYDPDLKEKIKKMQFQCTKEDDEETRHLKLSFFRSKRPLKDTRNSSLPNQIKWLEELVVKSLLYYFPNQPREVERYIKMAGYRGEEEIDELIYRTVGRVPESECLFKGDRGKRYEKKLRTGRVSHVNDRYMHPLDLAIRDRKQKEKEDKKH